MRKILPSMFTAALITSSQASATCEVAHLLEFKVTMEGMKPIANIGINGRALPFIVDSGAFFSDITPGTAQELGLRLEASPVQVGGIGGMARSTYLTRVNTLELAGYPIHDVRFLVAGGEFDGAAGLLGQNVLGLADVEYDLPHGAVRLMRSKGCSAKDNLAYWSGQNPVSDLEIDYRDEAHAHTIGTVSINGVKLRAGFDTGAGKSSLSLQAARRAGLTPSTPGVVPAGLSRGVGRSMVQTWLAPIDSVKIGTEEVRHVNIFMQDLDSGQADMLIGADFFLSHRVYVSNALRRMYFTYEGGPVFNTTPTKIVDETGAARTVAADSTPEPTDADGYSRRGAAEIERRDYKAALADLDRAVAMAPGNGRYLFERARAQLRTSNRVAGFADLDRAVQVSPNDPQIRLVHAQSLLSRTRKEEGLKDLQALDATLPPQADDRLALAALFGQLDQFDRSIANYDQWIKAHPDDSRQPVALNGRCWTRALAGRDLPLALKDCDAAVHRAESGAFFDSRGLVELRMGQYDKAIDDYTRALLLAPRTAWSLYGRGLAWRHKRNPSAQRELDAAVAIDPTLPARAKTLGIN